MGSRFILEFNLHLMGLFVDVGFTFDQLVFPAFVRLVVFFEPGVLGLHKVKVFKFLNQETDIVDDLLPKLSPDFQALLELVLPGLDELEPGYDLFLKLEVLLFDGSFLFFDLRSVLGDFLLELLDFHSTLMVLELEFLHGSVLVRQLVL